MDHNICPIEVQRSGGDLSPISTVEEYQVRAAYGRCVASFQTKELVERWFAEKNRISSLEVFRVTVTEEKINVSRPQASS